MGTPIVKTKKALLQRERDRCLLLFSAFEAK